ncbi:MAG: hypothetical protein ACR2QH_15465 [Geminicoccaceae bacterium]
MDQDTDAWLQPLADLVEKQQGQGGILLTMPDFRPDLTRVIADRLGFAFFDFRADILMPLGWEAAKVTLDQLTDALAERALDGGVVAHNVEALLATKEPVARQGWLERFSIDPWPHPVIVPMFLFSEEVQFLSPNVLHFTERDLPEETLLGQLRFWGS